MRNFSTVDRDYRLWVLLLQTSDAIYKAREKELSPLGLSAMAAAALFVIKLIGERATPAEISRWMFRESHSVSGLLDRMQEKGLIKRTKDLEKKNLVRVSLTDKGKQAYESSLDIEAIHRILSSLSEEQRQQLATCLEILRNKAVEELRTERELPFPGPL
ncbi:MAG: MarR family winged helix-turn-helix transcriptional regulator [Dehalococcoidia bacterium]